MYGNLFINSPNLWNKLFYFKIDSKLRKIKRLNFLKKNKFNRKRKNQRKLIELYLLKKKENNFYLKLNMKTIQRKFYLIWSLEKRIQIFSFNFMKVILSLNNDHLLLN